ncbi:DMT family transporter [Tatumella sp. UBA2305]|uniref:DMT family transporter n=1 Tax=Tatumella sp. UBA2305 TaxID=1947647 RepID=UPI0025F83ED0|nr:DMT family transporter [Tatumella sp. UBA2305]
MPERKHPLTAQAGTALFVLLWGSAAIFTRLGLNDASPLALLICRFIVALSVLLLIGFLRGRWLPAKGSRCRVALTGLIFIGGYSVCYFRAMALGITPGLMATLLGIQPILTLCMTERGFTGMRLAGLMIALSGLVLLVWRSLSSSHLAASGMLYALAALLFITTGTLMQKKIAQPPADVMPLQYAVSLLLCLCLTPLSGFQLHFSLPLIISVLFLGVLISVVAQLLFYRLLNTGSLVNVTSLFYLVPVITALLDYLTLGNRLSPAACAGMAAIFAGIWLVYRSGNTRSRPTDLTTSRNHSTD